MIRKLFLILFLAIFVSNISVAQKKEENNNFGGWEFLEVVYNFKNSPMFASVYFEHDNYQYKRLECWY